MLKVRIQALLVNLHRQRANRFGQVLARANSFHELQVRNYYLSLLAEQDVEVVNRARHHPDGSSPRRKSNSIRQIRRARGEERRVRRDRDAAGR